MKKKYLAIILSVLMILSSSMAVFAAFPQNSLNTVVSIWEKVDLDGTGEYENYGRGTGFFIGKNGKSPEYVVTNCHVIEDFLVAGGGQTKIMQLVVAYGENDTEEAYVVDYNVDSDLALLRLDTPTDKRTPLKLEEPKNSDVGNMFYAIGYPALADANANVSNLGTGDATVTSGSVSRLATETGTGRKVLQMDVDIKGGNSGGPLVNEKGNVVGINTSSWQTNEGVGLGMSYAVSVSELIPLLERNNVDYDVYNGIPLLPIIIGVAAVIILLLLIFIIVKLIKGKGSQSKSMDNSGKKVTKAKKGARPMVRSLSIQHNGLRLALSQDPIIIGRDPSSSIVFSNDTAGVSRRHCTVSFDFSTGDFILIDLGSSYGTFLQNGQRLNPNSACRLRAGDSFYLGESVNMLRFEME